ncbi:AraC family transcriptional regulator [Pseudomonas sp. BP8]|uniref:helix-turn-helix domain-containing protein n=1 Tax=Pseudomonas sp. BP8 TaxID=2817864 RepID=UPI001AE5E096|nr:AraC family transcriptional regulator [Pseudomonas sp. BP8]MBP2262300.1 AraC-like DNA-binding protein [Pseudomonas sp. BP8]HDS1733221.1 helix-turn-helix domain-containing protein [Pseudomonas putida]
MKPCYEKVPTAPTASWTLLNRRLPDEIPFEWHHHPEYELTLTLNSRGHRYIGSDVQLYDDCDLTLVGPNVPHSWCSAELIEDSKPHHALVIWFSEAWATSLVALFPEMAQIGNLLAAAQCAMTFSPKAARELRPIIEDMVDQNDPERLVALLHVLIRLTQDDGAQRIVANDDSLTAPITDDSRLHRVLDHIHANFAQQLSIPELADMACVSVSAFHRMFKRHTRCSALDYIARLRIGRACALLMEGGSVIALVSGEVGYTSVAFFNRQFKALKGMTPTEFRRLHGHHFK